MGQHFAQFPIKRMMDTPAPVGHFLEELEQLCVKHAMVIMKETVGPLVVAPITATGLEDLIVNVHLSRRFFDHEAYS